MAARGEAGRRLRPAGRLRGRAGAGRPVQAVPGGGEGRPAAERRRGGGGGPRLPGRGRGAGTAGGTGSGARRGERAKAELQAAEQRKRRKVQLALAGAVLLLAAGGGAFAVVGLDRAGQRRRRRRRGAAAADRGRPARQREAGTRGPQPRCLRRLAGTVRERPPRADDAYTAGLALARGPEALARGRHRGVRRPDRAVSDGPGVAPGTGSHRRLPLDTGREQAPGCARRSRPGGSRRLPGSGSCPARPPRPRQPAELAESLIRERLLAALDLWLVFGGSPKLAEILAASDPDAYRDAVRAAVRVRGAWLVQVLAAAGAAMEQPARFAVALGVNHDHPGRAAAGGASEGGGRPAGRPEHPDGPGRDVPDQSGRGCRGAAALASGGRGGSPAECGRPQQPGDCPVCQGPVGRGHRRVQAGHHTRPEARMGPQQPGNCPV